MLIRLEGDNTLGSWHLDCDMGSVDDRHQLKDERSPQDTMYPMSKLAISNVSISLHLFSLDPQDTSRSMHPMGVDDYPGMIP
jgi:hypothetical protein